MAKKSEDEKNISSDATGVASEKSDAALKAGKKGVNAPSKETKAKAAAKSVELDAKSAKPTVEPAEPVVELAEPVVESAEPVAAQEPIQETAGPRRPPTMEGGEVEVEFATTESAEDFTYSGEPTDGKASCGVFCAWFSHFKLGGLCTALSFLTRLGPARERSEDEMRASVAFYPLVGLLLGFLALVPVWLVPAGYFWLKAWVFSVLMLWLTRGLHWDGLADLTDALGSNRSGDDFQAVLKDSRSGVFAILAVVFCALGYVFAVQTLLSSKACLPLILAPAFARCVPMYIGNLSRPHAGSSLGKIIERATDLKLAVAWTAALALVAVLAGYVLGAVLALLVSAAVLYYLLNLSERHDGYNGDFLGAGIVVVEVGVLLAFIWG